MLLELTKMDGNILFLNVEVISSIEEYQDEDGETVTVIVTKNSEPHYIDMPAVSIYHEYQTLMEQINAEKHISQFS